MFLSVNLPLVGRDYFLRTTYSWITVSGVGLWRIPNNVSLNWTNIYIYLMHNRKQYSQTLVILNMERKLTWWILCLQILNIFIEDSLFSNEMLCCQNIFHYKFKFIYIISLILQGQIEQCSLMVIDFELRAPFIKILIDYIISGMCLWLFFFFLEKIFAYPNRPIVFIE